MNLNAAGRGLQNTQDHVDGGGLPGAVRTEQADDLALIDDKRNLVYGNGRTVRLSEIRYGEDVHAIANDRIRPGLGRTVFSR